MPFGIMTTNQTLAFTIKRLRRSRQLYKVSLGALIPISHLCFGPYDAASHGTTN